MFGNSLSIHLKKMSQRILVRLTSNHLMMANTGRAFSKEGFEAVCYTDTSSKRGNTTTRAESEEEAKNWIADLIKRKRTTFGDRNQLESASGTEQRTTGDYSGRLLLELFQNAIDADREEQIGYKGIGFRSVLNEGEAVEVHSGNLHVRWSDADARAALADMGDLPQHLPILDLPAWCDPNDKTRKVLGNGYQTVVQLHLTPEGRKRLVDEWFQTVRDPSLLLFVDGTIEVGWELDDESPVCWSRRDEGNHIVVTEQSGESVPSLYRWRSFAAGKARAAYAINGEGSFQASGVQNPRLRCYFPAHQSPHPFPNLYLHHGGFALQSNREAVEMDDERLQELAKAIARVAESVHSEGEVLDLIHRGELDRDDKDRSETKVWEATRELVSKTTLKGLSNRSLAEIKSCPNSDDLPYKWRGEDRQKCWAAFLRAVELHRPNGLQSLPVLEPGVENDNREKTLLAFNPNCRFTKSELQALDWAPVEASDVSVSSSVFKLFLPHKGASLNPPQGLRVRFLNQAFVKAFQAAGKDSAERFLKDFLGVLEFSALSVIEHCVLPSDLLSKDKPASDELVAFLKALREADDKEAKKTVESFDWRDQVRRELIQKLHLSLQADSWPILKVYASERWTGNSFLETAYRDTRGFLEMEPPTDEKERNEWEDFWKWLGVGWCPKVLPLLSKVCHQCEDQQGWEWYGSQFSGKTFSDQAVPSDWREYCQALRDNGSFNRWDYTPRMKANWTIDGGVDLLRNPGAFRIIGKNWSSYQRWMKASIGYSTNRQWDFDNDNCERLPSFLAWLFSNATWVPCAGVSLHVGQKVFKESGEVAKAVPSFVPILKHKDDGNGDEKLPPEFLVQCGIRGGWNEVLDQDWKRWLKKASQMLEASTGSKSHRDDIRLLYKALLEHRKSRDGESRNAPEAEPLRGVDLWSIERSEAVGEAWHLHRPGEPPLYYVDRGDVADIALPGLRVFPQRLDGLADKAKKHLGIEPLSGVLLGTPIFEGEMVPEYSIKASQRVHELVAYLKVGQNDHEDARLEQALYSVNLYQVSDLRVHYALGKELVGEPLQRADFRKQDGTFWKVYVDESRCLGDRRWEVFAETLLLACGLLTEKAKNIRDLLRYEEGDLPAELLRLGVAPETVESLKQRLESLPQRPPEATPAPQSTPVQPTMSVNDIENLGGQPNQVTPSVLTSAPSTPRERTYPYEAGTRSARSDEGAGEHVTRAASRPRPEEGMSAQRWLLEQVKSWCQGQSLPDPLWEKDHVDITIPTTPPILIEAKRIEGMTVHWSRNQIEKAMKSKGAYVVALLQPSETSEYEVYWVMHPLEELGKLPNRRIEWTWQLQKGAPFAQGSWDEPEARPSRAASGFQAEVPLDGQWLNNLPRGIEQIAKLTNPEKGNPGA